MAQRLRSATGQLVARQPDRLRRQLPGDGKNIYAAPVRGVSVPRRALAQSLFDAGLIDTIRLIVFPVVLGSGKRLFPDGRTPSSFRLAEATSTPSGVTMQTLELTGTPEYGEVEVE